MVSRAKFLLQIFQSTTIHYNSCGLARVKSRPSGTTTTVAIDGSVRVLWNNEVIKMLAKMVFSFVPIIDMVLTHKSKRCCKRWAYGVIGNASSQQNINFCKIHKENLDLMNMYCLFRCGIFPWPTSWKLLWHDGNQHLLNYDTWLVVHACMIRVHFLHLMSFPPITDVKFSSQNILFYFLYQPTPIINKMHVQRWVRNQNTYQNSKGEKNNQPKPCSGKFVQNWIWPKGKLARKC